MRKSLLALLLLLTIGPTAFPLGMAPAARADTVSGEAIVQTALRYVGYAYTTVGNSPATGFSCIGLVSYVYQVNGIPLPDDLWDAQAYAAPVALSNLLPGDVLFFGNTVWAGLSHTAIYLGGGRFVHAAWYNRGVIISSLTNDPVDGNYWIDHYIGANRPWGGTVPSPAVVQTAPAPPRPALPSGPHLKVQVGALNVRVRPSLFAPVNQLVAGGTSVVVLKRYHSWDWVQMPNGDGGWVSGAGIGDRAAGTTSAPRSAYLGSLPHMRVSVDGLRVRTRPGMLAPIITAVYRGQRLAVLQRWNGWARVILPGGTRGWVRTALSAVPARLNPAPATSATVRRSSSRVSYAPIRRGSATVTVAVRLRFRPGLAARVAGLVVPGMTVRVLGSWGAWAYIRLGDGGKGWMYRAYLQR